MDILKPDWPAPSNVCAAISTRCGGQSLHPWNSLNLGSHVGDAPASVEQNWQLLSTHLALPSAPQLLNQIHGTDMIKAGCDGVILTADGSFTDVPGRVCTIMTADCLPILICNTTGTEVAAVHAGWRGLAAGVVGNAIKQFSSPPEDLMTYLGPAISQQHFEVGNEVRRKFLDNVTNEDCRGKVKTCFLKSGDDLKNHDVHWIADLYGLAKITLNAGGVTQVYGGNFCTYKDSEKFYSYRREGQTGRMASLIWIS